MRLDTEINSVSKVICYFFTTRLVISSGYHLQLIILIYSVQGEGICTQSHCYTPASVIYFNSYHADAENKTMDKTDCPNRVFKRKCPEKNNLKKEVKFNYILVRYPNNFEFLTELKSIIQELVASKTISKFHLLMWFCQKKSGGVTKRCYISWFLPPTPQALVVPVGFSKQSEWVVLTSGKYKGFSNMQEGLFWIPYVDLFLSAIIQQLVVNWK